MADAEARSLLSLGDNGIADTISGIWTSSLREHTHKANKESYKLIKV